MENNMNGSSVIDSEWLTDRQYVAIVLREYLRPIGGYDNPIFPPTFAIRPTLQQRHPYNIDQLRNGENICLIDSVASQANRLEPIFDEFSPRIVRKATVKVTSGKKIIEERRSLLEVGHRVADAVVRFSDKADDIARALKNHDTGNSVDLAKDFATSLVFGAWNSRDAGEKVPRILQSTIRATNVEPLTRASQYVPPFNYKELLDEQDKPIIDPRTPDKKLSNLGLLAVPVVTMKTKEKNKDLAFRVHGGILVNGDIRRDASINLANLRALRTGDVKEVTPTALRSYILGLSLVALLYDQEFTLRQDCQLVLDPDRTGERVKQAEERGLAYGRHRLALVTRDGKETPLNIRYDDARSFAENAAGEKGMKIDQSELVITFDPAKMRTAIKTTTEEAEEEA
jgi:CRISPR-associated protein Csb1